MRTLPINRPTLDDPLYSQKNPHQTFLLALSVLGNLPLLRGDISSAALSSQLSPIAAWTWAACLLVGSLIALGGEFWPGHTWGGLVVERAGLALVAVAAAVYAVVVWVSVGGVLTGVHQWGLYGTLLAIAGVLAYATINGPVTAVRLAQRTVLAAIAGFSVGTYAGAVWNADPRTVGATYAVSIQIAYSLSCAWRVGQITRRLRYIDQLRAELYAERGD